MKIAIIGGGAAGFFSAIHAKENHPHADVSILEKTQKILSKVKISGGGRCNVTNGTRSIKDLCGAYPRGHKFLKKNFVDFNTKHTYEWFEDRGVPLMIQEDQCVFPVSQDSQSIIDCLLNETRRLSIDIKLGHGVQEIRPVDSGIELQIKNQDQNIFYDKVILATGGSPKRSGLEWLEKLGHQIEDPVPSLFTFNMPHEKIKSLMGIVVENTLVSIQGTKLKSDGPLLITHWGMSGPAILKLSAFGARILNESDYKFKVQVNWVNDLNQQNVMDTLKIIQQDFPQKLLSNYRPYLLPDRLWQFLIIRGELDPKRKWIDLGKKGLNKIVQLLSNDVYQVHGKTTFKEEFVTCGGVSLKSINPKTMESTVVKNLYFSGELMDIDGITGGYNFQAAWTTGFVAGRLG